MQNPVLAGRKKRSLNQPLKKLGNISVKTVIRKISLIFFGRNIPPYPYRQGFVPLELEDFGDGGAYPEIHVVQYPLNMGRPGHKSTALVAVSLDSDGAIQTDMIIKQGTNKSRMIQSKMDDIKEKVLVSEYLLLLSFERIVLFSSGQRQG